METAAMCLCSALTAATLLMLVALWSFARELMRRRTAPLPPPATQLPAAGGDAAVFALEVYPRTLETVTLADGRVTSALPLHLRNTDAAQALQAAVASGAVAHLTLDNKTFEAMPGAAFAAEAPPDLWLLPPEKGEVFPFAVAADAVELPRYPTGDGPHRCFALAF
jgi:hypothetical protein